ncbi:hypothetical protein PLESTB_001439700 [Pleodorina starrii]|uniref:Plastid lipid-associated protein/fibrillin conserved domain-containing protein n=1 Tax=Pleodorina starrii TaxID=330485 RepID=A0A9W6BWI7_9CHLO|nr:hypothetical protein PLESTB_001439700 [Pleodorina starrii]
MIAARQLVGTGGNGLHTRTVIRHGAGANRRAVVQHQTLSVQRRQRLRWTTTHGYIQPLWERPIATLRALSVEPEPELVAPQGDASPSVLETPANVYVVPEPLTKSGAAAVGPDAAVGTAAADGSTDNPNSTSTLVGSLAPPSVAPTPSSASTSSHGRLEMEGSGGQRKGKQIERLRVSLLAALSSLDRGLAANAREAAEVDELCSRLEGLGGPVVLAPRGLGAAASGGGGAGGSADDLLSGTWRLVYSSGFNSGSLGGRRPGPPAALFPTTLGQVYQRIDPDMAKLDNIVELLLSYGPPDWGLLGLGQEALGRGLSGLGRQLGLDLKSEQLPPPLRELFGEKASSVNQPGKQGRGQQREAPAARLTLRHDYEVTSPATVRIVYEETYGELVGSDLFAQLPRLEAPSLPEPLRPPKFLRSATFEVTFLDETMRITRGDRGELRVYLRDTEAGALVSLSGGAEAAKGAIALDYDD